MESLSSHRAYIYDAFAASAAELTNTAGDRLAFGASALCVTAALLVAVFPGWVIGRF